MITEIVNFTDLRVGDTFWIEGFKNVVENYAIRNNGDVCLVTFNCYLNLVENYSTKLYGNSQVIRKVKLPKVADTIEEFLAQIKA